jgi:hypothetical protein
MSARVPLKNSLFMFLGGFVCSVGTAFLVNFLLAGPELGAHYDFLLKRRQPPVVSREILIIKTDEFAEGGDVFTVLMTLTEMEAANLIQTGRVSHSSSPITLTETEIRRRFTDEYVLIGSNIRKLFEGIRMGSITPREAPSYVDRVVELTEYGRERLLAALVDRDEALIRSAAVFGNYLEVDAGPLLDNDGKIRRVRPIDTEASFEHPVYISLKNRYIASQIETSDQGLILWLRKLDGNDFDIPLDRNGNIITAWNCAFRVLDIALFREYGEAGRAVRDALTAADKLGAFSQTLPEKSPLFLDDYAFALQEELLKSPGVENRFAWTAARAEYLKSLDDFLNGTAEMILVSGYEKLIADVALSNREQLAALSKMRDELIQSFAQMREEYKKLSSLHAVLKEELETSFCIMGPEENAQYSALLANALITGSHIKPVYNRYALFWSIAASFIVLIIVFMMRPSVLLTVGLAMSFLSSAAFGCFFIFYSYWIDPLVALYASIAGTLVIFCSKCVFLNNRANRFRAAYGNAVSQDVLGSLIDLGKPAPSEINVSFSAVVAVKDINLLNREMREKPQDAGKARKSFLEAAKKIFFSAGAVIAGFESDTIFVCFGSPLNKSDNPSARACAMVRELLKSEKIPWHFGIDAGVCTFLWSPETGFSVNGRTVVRARILVSKAVRFQVRALITDSVREKINFAGIKAGSLSGEDDPFFEFPQ